MDEISEPIAEEELREFLEPGPMAVPADPAFKRRLRGRLWNIVQLKFARRRAPAGPPLSAGDARAEPDPQGKKR